MDKNYQVVFTQKSTVELMEVPIPEPQENEILIKSLVTQISTGTELTMLEANVEENTPWARTIKYPTYPGYSNVGKVVAVGEGVDPALVGKTVLTPCEHGKYVVRNLNDTHWIVPDNVANDDAVFGILACITMGSIRAAQVKPGETTVVFGAGLIGQLVARFAKIAGAINVYVVDVSDQRLAMVPKDKCFIPVNSKDINVSAFIKEHNGAFADVVFETTGYHPLVQSELECVAANGRLIITSSPKGRSTVDFDFCSRRGITIIGAHNFRVHPSVATTLNPWTRQRETAYYLQLLEKEQLTLQNMITHKANYKKAVDMYKLLMEDRTKAMAVHLYWEDEE